MIIFFNLPQFFNYEILKHTERGTIWKAADVLKLSSEVLKHMSPKSKHSLNANTIIAPRKISNNSRKSSNIQSMLKFPKLSQKLFTAIFFFKQDLIQTLHHICYYFSNPFKSKTIHLHFPRSPHAIYQSGSFLSEAVLLGSSWHATFKLPEVQCWTVSQKLNLHAEGRRVWVACYAQNVSWFTHPALIFMGVLAVSNLLLL